MKLEDNKSTRQLGGVYFEEPRRVHVREAKWCIRVSLSHVRYEWYEYVVRFIFFGVLYRSNCDSLYTVISMNHAYEIRIEAPLAILSCLWS